MVSKEYLKAKQAVIREELFTYSLPFWTKYGPDKEYGGILTCLTREGKVSSHDKNAWQQGRAAWTFSRACNQYGKNEEYLAIAKSCLDFLDAHFFDETGKSYYTVTREGNPLRMRRWDYGDDSFYTTGNAEYYRATGEEKYLENARKRFALQIDRYYGRLEKPANYQPKFFDRPTRSFGSAMIALDVCDVMRLADKENAAEYQARMKEYAYDIFKYNYKEDLNCMLESVGPNGEFLSDWTVGRKVNPGHGLEGVWFLVKAAKTVGDPYLVEMAEKIYKSCLDQGWDKEYGGILMFVDALGFQPEEYEHDMKFWWVIDEAICAALSLYEATGKDQYIFDFEKFLDYYFTYHADHEYGDCIGYLRRDGKPTMPIAKGNLYKGPFHTPRMLMHVDEVLGRLIDTQA